MGTLMRFGVCMSYREIAGLEAPPLDFLEESVQRFLLPERPRDEFEAQWRAARRLSIPIEVANLLFPRDLKLIATPSRAVDARRLERYVKTVIERAAQVGIQVIVFGGGLSRANPPDGDPDEAVRQIGEHLARWGAWAETYGVEIALEPLRYEETNVVNTVAEGATLVTRLAAPSVRLLADIYHMACNEEPPESLGRLAPLLAHAHIAERRERAAPGTFGEDPRPFFAVLQQGGYDRRISIECDWRDFAAQVGPAIATLRAQWRSAGALLAPQVP